MNRLSFLYLICCSTALITPLTVYGASLDDLGDLTGGSASSTAYGINADGTVVVGYGTSAGGTEAFRWTAGTGMVGLGDLTGGIFYSTGQKINDDGSVIIGTSYGTLNYEAFRWTAGSGMTALGALAGGLYSYANGVSADGSVVVGYSMSAASGFGRGEAFRWTSGTGMVSLGDFAGGVLDSQAYATNSDGSIIVGYGTNASGIEAFRWTSGTGLVGLGELAGGSYFSNAKAISADETVIVGDSNSANGYEAFRWTSGTGMVGLGDLAGGIFYSRAFDVSADGSVIVGYGSSASGAEAFLWTQSTGMQSLADILTADGVDLTNWVLSSANDISDDGNIIVGQATHNGNTTAFLVNLLAGGLTSTTDLIQSLSTISQTAQQVATTAMQYSPQGVFLAQHVSEFAVPVIRQQPINRDHPASISPAAGDESNEIRIIDTGLSVFVLSAYGIGQNNDFDNHEWSGTAGINAQVTDDINVGVGLVKGQSNYSLDFDGTSEMNALGALALASYQPDDFGLRLYGTAYGVKIDLDTDRGYLNGANTDFSHGETDGWSYGGAAKVGWEEHIINRKTSIMPYVEARYSQTKLDGYNETGGAFAASFSEQDSQSVSSRIGLELAYEVNEDLKFLARPAWGHRIKGNGGEITANVSGLTQNLAWDAGDKDWAEGTVGASWQATQTLHISTELTGRLGDTSDPAASLLLGASLSF